MKTVITFGSSQLAWLHDRLNPMNVALVVEAESENEARKKVFNSRIGKFFATSYTYNNYIELFKDMSMKEYSLDELEDLS